MYSNIYFTGVYRRTLEYLIYTKAVSIVVEGNRAVPREVHNHPQVAGGPSHVRPLRKPGAGTELTETALVASFRVIALW